VLIAIATFCMWILYGLLSSRLLLCLFACFAFFGVLCVFVRAAWSVGRCLPSNADPHVNAAVRRTCA
jgi:hypothetical protein